jgi:hypothetical protein
MAVERQSARERAPYDPLALRPDPKPGSALSPIERFAIIGSLTVAVAIAGYYLSHIVGAVPQ